MEVIKKIDIRQLDKNELTEYFVKIGEKAFRAKQVYEWLWKKGAVDFDDMTNISLALREKMKTHFEIRFLTIEEEQKSTDRTIKSAFKLSDGSVVEGVLIPSSKRMTACICMPMPFVLPMSR